MTDTPTPTPPQSGSGVRAKAADAATGIAAGAAKGAAKGAAGGAAGAAAGAVRGAALAAARDRNVRRGLMFVALAVVTMMVAGVALFTMTTVGMAQMVGLADQNAQYTAATSSNISLDDIDAARHAADGLGVPWPLVASIKKVTDDDVDVLALRDALYEAGMSGAGITLGAGMVYNSAKSLRHIGEGPAEQAAHQHERTAVITALEAYGLSSTDARYTYLLALRWMLGQVNNCFAGPVEPAVTPSPSPSPSAEPSPSPSPDEEEEDEPERPRTCYEGLLVLGDAVHPLGTHEGAPVTSQFGPRESIRGSSSFHRGIDFGVACDRPIYAIMDGTVVFSGYQGGWGNSVVIQHDNGMWTRSAHMPYTTASGDNGRAVVNGERVAVGQLIGFIGQTGVSLGCHLHLETILGGSQVDPVPVMYHLGIRLGLPGEDDIFGED